jgi:hypothetical protein
MTATNVFSLVNMLAMLMWIFMIIAPKWKVTRFLIDFKVVPIALAGIYAIYILKAVQIGGMMDFGSLTSVMALFTEENAVLSGWVHYLVFDLLIGMWMLDQNKKLNINQFILAPCLLFTFMMGPIGFLLFTIVKTIKQKQS